MNSNNDKTKKTLLALSIAAAASSVQATDVEFKGICESQPTKAKVASCEELVAKLATRAVNTYEFNSFDVNRYDVAAGVADYLNDVTVNTTNAQVREFTCIYAGYVEDEYGVQGSELQEIIETVTTRVVRDFTCARVVQE